MKTTLLAGCRRRARPGNRAQPGFEGFLLSTASRWSRRISCIAIGSWLTAVGWGTSSGAAGRTGASSCPRAHFQPLTCQSLFDSLPPAAQIAGTAGDKQCSLIASVPSTTLRAARASGCRITSYTVEFRGASRTVRGELSLMFGRITGIHPDGAPLRRGEVGWISVRYNSRARLRSRVRARAPGPVERHS